MAEKKPDNCCSSEKRAVLVSAGSSSTEMSTAASSDLQPFSLGRASSSSTLSPSNLSSYTVPVRLDVLYFLLNSATKGAQNALPSLPAHGGQGSFPTCPCPATQHAVSCCRSCHHSSCGGVANPANIPHPTGGAHHFGPPQGGYGGQGGSNAGVPENQNTGQRWVSPTHQNYAKAWPSSSQPHSASAWKSSQSTVGWNQREEGSGRGNNWQGRRPSNGRSWGDRRQDTTESCFSRSGSKDWRREGSPFGSNFGSSRRNQEGSHRKMPWDVPEAKRRSDDVRVGWQKNQGNLEVTSSLSKVRDACPAKPSLIQVGGEDWEMDYESKETSSATQASVSHPDHQKNQGDTSRTSEACQSKCTPSSSPTKLRPRASPLLGSPSEDPESSATRKESFVSQADQSKNGGFVSYLKGLYSDLPGKSSSEGSTDLAIDTDKESSKPSEEEQSPKNAAGEESKAWE